METQPDRIAIPDPKQARRAASLCAFAVVASHVIAYALFYAVQYLTRDVLPADSNNILLIVNTVINDCIALPLAWLIFLRPLSKNAALAPDAQDRTPFRFRTFAFFLPCAYAVIAAGSMTGRLVGALFGGFNDLVSGLVTQVHPIVTLLCASIAAPIAEEFFFRKAIIDRLSCFHPMDAILFSALLFGLMHGNVTQFLYAFPMGVLFGIIYWRTKNIRYTIALHVAINTLGGVLPVLVMQTQNLSDDGGVYAMIGTLIAMLYASAMLALIVLGVVRLIRHRKRFLPIESPLPRVRKPFYLNVGWFVACAVFTAMFVWIELLKR